MDYQFVQNASLLTCKKETGYKVSTIFSASTRLCVPIRWKSDCNNRSCNSSWTGMVIRWNRGTMVSSRTWFPIWLTKW